MMTAREADLLWEKVVDENEDPHVDHWETRARNLGFINQPGLCTCRHDARYGHDLQCGWFKED